MIDHSQIDLLTESAGKAAGMLRLLGNERRLMILCHLSSGEKSVTELEELLSARQAAVSQQLSRLRVEGLVTPRREGKAIYYRLTDRRAIMMVDMIYKLFCKRP